MTDSLIIDSVESLFKATNDQGEIKSRAQIMLLLRSWLTEVTSFDPVSGQTLTTGIDEFSAAVATLILDETLQDNTKDRIFRIVAHSNQAILAIMGHTREKILREHAMLPVYAAREVDSKSIQWLSRLPGRTLREKLASKPYIKAVRRRPSVDTGENRLFKAFLLRLEQVLIARQSGLKLTSEDICEELLVSIQRWKRTDESFEIGVWENLPPNNILLQDKRYRKTWDSWLWLQSLDENIRGDCVRIQRDILSIVFWQTFALLNQCRRFRTVQQPLHLDYENFDISPQIPIIGYLFPVSDLKIKGRIRYIDYESEYGFLTSETNTDLFFHKTNLAQNIDINLLSVGDSVAFSIGKNRKGKCANNITIAGHITPVVFTPSDDECNIQVGENELSLKIENNQLIIFHDHGIQERYEVSTTTFTEIPKTILSIIMNSSFEASAGGYDQGDLIRLDSCVIDLCSVRPRYISQTGVHALLPFRLLLQNWPQHNGDSSLIDCAVSKAIALKSDIDTISMKSLFDPKSTLAEAVKSDASMIFTKKLRDYIIADQLTYLVPDWMNDFDMETIRKSLNYYFEDATPLPKSIAAVFAWQSSNNFDKNTVRENDLVLVIDLFKDGISVTPVQANYMRELAKIVPETYGISWERHPTFNIEISNLYVDLVQNLTKEGCLDAELLIQLFGLDGLSRDASELSFVIDDNWYHLPDSVGKIMKIDLNRDVISTETISTFLNSVEGDWKVSNIFLIPVEDTIYNKGETSQYQWINEHPYLVEGGEVLNRWQKDAGHITLWRDHLPELSIRIVRGGHYENFYLVKDATVTPERGRTVNIPVDESFTLPAGQTHYSFPLQQGEGNRELKFNVHLRSPAFPLMEATTCKLQMTYTYGADDPYELIFIPLNSEKTEFKSVHAEWRSASEGTSLDLQSLPIPDFPARKSWSEFQHFPKENSEGFSDLLQWVKEEIRKINDIDTFGRVSGPIDSWIDKGSENVFCFIEDTFIHKSFIKLAKNQEYPQPGDILSFYKIKNDRGQFYAEDVIIGNSQPPQCFFSRSLRFPVLTIWNHGHSLSESEVPEQFRSTIFESIPKVVSIIESENAPDTLKEELFFFLSCLHKDAPAIVHTRLLSAIEDKELLRKYYRNIAYAIGSGELPWQYELLNKIINPIDNAGLTRSIAMEVLSIALWRSEGLINELTLDDLTTLYQNLLGCLEFDLYKVVNDGKGHQIAVLFKHLELLLALLRSRGNEDEGFKMILAPENDLTKKYVTLVDEVSRIAIDGGFELKSRLDLKFEEPKPEMFHNTPDLLYALRMYLTGDSGANTISVMAVSDE